MRAGGVSGLFRKSHVLDHDDALSSHSRGGTHSQEEVILPHFETHAHIQEETLDPPSVAEEIMSLHVVIGHLAESEVVFKYGANAQAHVEPVGHPHEGVHVYHKAQHEGSRAEVVRFRGPAVRHVHHGKRVEISQGELVVVYFISLFFGFGPVDSFSPRTFFCCSLLNVLYRSWVLADFTSASDSICGRRPSPGHVVVGRGPVVHEAVIALPMEAAPRAEAVRVRDIRVSRR